MRQKLQIDREVARLEDFHIARRSPASWMSGHKLGILQGLFLGEDAGCSRRHYAAANGISVRTLQRWVHQLNAGGLAGALEPVQCRPGRKRKVSLLEFRERILPAAQLALRQSSRPDTIKNLFESARDLGLFNASYATFRRRLRLTSSDYKRRRIEPTIDELMFQTQTGRWPARLKAFGRRRQQRQKQAWQRMRDDCQEESARWKAEAAAAA